MKSCTRTLILLAVLATLAEVRGAWGDFDTTFGTQGFAADATVINHYPLAIALQPDGKILVTGYKLSGGRRLFFLRRYLSNGQVDTSFGNNGFAIWNSLITTDTNYDGSRIVVQTDGKIAVGGVGNHRPTLWRFSASGNPDTSIGQGGMRTFTAYSEHSGASIATHNNILYIALSKPGETSPVVIKINPNGIQDGSFGEDGEAATRVHYYSYSIGVDSAGNIIMGGRSRLDAGYVGIERILPSGATDNHFAPFTIPYGGYPPPPTRFIQLPNGEFVFNNRWLWENFGFDNYVVEGQAVRISNHGEVVAASHYQPLLLDYGTPSGSCPDILAIQQDGRIVLKGPNNTALFRMRTDFSAVQTMYCGNYATLATRTNAVLQSDDKMPVAGWHNGKITIIRTLP